MKIIERPVIELEAPVSIANADSGNENRRFEIIAYTGKVINTWFGGFVIDIAGIQTKEKVPILREHMHDRIVGWSDEMVRETGSLKLAGSFSGVTQDGREVLALADEGFPWQASMGVKPLQVRQLKDANETVVVNGKKLNGPLEIWTKSLLGETSMVSWGADNDTGLKLLSENEKGEMVSVETLSESAEGDRTMTFEEFKAKHPDLFEQAQKLGAETALASLEEAQKKARTDGELAERSRVMEILGADGDPAVSKDAVEKGLSPVETFKLLFKAEKEGRDKALKDLQESLSGSAGGQGKEKGADSGKNFLAEVNRYQAEHKCGRAQAVKAIVAANPELHEAYLSGPRESKN